MDLNGLLEWYDASTIGTWMGLDRRGVGKQMAGMESTSLIEVVNMTQVSYGPSLLGYCEPYRFTYHFGMDPYGKWVMHEYHGSLNNWVRSVIGVSDKDPFLEPIPSPPVPKVTK